ncbi:hypothetical protein JNW90_14920 [Micromonospora sp. STR1s_5]|nr:hypothetical protein [Micromonospora sp. STR1s_5]
MSRLYVRLHDEAKLVVWQRDEVAVERGTVAELVRSAVKRMRSKAPPDNVDLAYGDDLLHWREISALHDRPTFPKIGPDPEGQH